MVTCHFNLMMQHTRRRPKSMILGRFHTRYSKRFERLTNGFYRLGANPDLRLEPTIQHLKQSSLKFTRNFIIFIVTLIANYNKNGLFTPVKKFNLKK